MPIFRFEAMNSQGQTIKNEVEAVSEEEAIQKIRAQKLFPTSVKPKVGRRGLTTGAGQKRKKSFAIGGVSDKQLTLFTRQLSTLQDAGLPIVRSLKILEGQLKPGVLKNTLITVADDVEGGMTFSEALAKHPKAFDKLYTNMVRAGEVGGVLDEILQRLADFREKSRRLQKQIVGAMVYPVAVITVAGGILWGIMTFIVPKFKQMFVELDVQLPAMTLMLIAFSDFIKNSWYWIPAGIVGFILFIKAIGATTCGRYILDKIKLRIPLFGNDPEQGRHRALHPHARHPRRLRRAHPRGAEHHQGHRRKHGHRPRHRPRARQHPRGREHRRAARPEQDLRRHGGQHG